MMFAMEVTGTIQSTIMTAMIHAIILVWKLFLILIFLSAGIYANPASGEILRTLCEVLVSSVNLNAVVILRVLFVHNIGVFLAVGSFNIRPVFSVGAVLPLVGQFRAAKSARNGCQGYFRSLEDFLSGQQTGFDFNRWFTGHFSFARNRELTGFITDSIVALFFFTGYFYYIVTGFFTLSPNFLLGDVNVDGAVNITDIILVVSYVLGDDVKMRIAAANVVRDKIISIADIAAIVSIVLD